MELRLSITYKNNEPLESVDDYLKAAMEKHGFEFIGSGYYIEENLRDMCFIATVDSLVPLDDEKGG